MTLNESQIVGVLARNPWLTSSEIAGRLQRIDDLAFRSEVYTVAYSVFVEGRNRFVLCGEDSDLVISGLIELVGIEVTPPDWREPYMTAEDYYAA